MSCFILFQYLWKRSSIDLKVPIPLEHVGISTEINKVRFQYGGPVVSNVAY